MASSKQDIYSYAWQKRGVEVMIKQSHPDIKLRYKSGVIWDVIGEKLVVLLLQEVKTVNVGRDQLRSTVPSVGDRVIVMGTDMSGATGVLKAVDSGDGIVSIQGIIKYFPLTFLARIVA